MAAAAADPVEAATPSLSKRLKRRLSTSPSGRQLPTPARQEPAASRTDAEDDDIECKPCDPEAVMSSKRTDYIEWDDYFMALAHLSAMRSKDPSTQVGAAIVNSENRICGIGYNGFPTGCSDDKLPWAREAADPLDTKYMYVCHAEMNAILNRISSDLRGCRMYVALFPCNDCAKLIIQSGIKEVVYAADKYHNTPSCIASRRLFDCSGVRYRPHSSSRKSITIQLDGNEAFNAGSSSVA